MEDADRGRRDAPRPEEQASAHATRARVLHGIDALHERLAHLERLLTAEGDGLRRGESRVAKSILPAWQRVTLGEPRWQVSLATIVAIALQLPLPNRLVLLRPAWLLPVLQGALLVGLVIANPRRINRRSTVLRYVSLGLIAAISLANVWSAARLADGLVRGVEGDNARALLATGAAIWLTNVIVFALWYWEFDRGGPVARAHALTPYPDFQFPQMASRETAPPDWEPQFPDYLYLSFTNATAFSPTDVMPLSRWAKMAMLVQSVVSLVIVILVIARAVNVLK